VQPVLRFKTPLTGTVSWEDKVKGRIEISNTELDDLVIARPDGTPTYNFCVVVDDMDMRITHVIRGDDHINNTPRQIHIFNALGYPTPTYAHLPTVLNAEGEKMSKRDPKTKSVMQYAAEGFLPEAMINYLARLGWSHGDDEIFSQAQFLQWFDLDHLGKSAAQFDEAKLRWVNAQHLKAMEDAALAAAVRPFVAERGLADTPEAQLQAACALFKDRCETLVDLADWIAAALRAPVLADIQNSADWQQHLAADKWPALRPAVALLMDKLQSCEWESSAISAAFKAALQETGFKMPQLAMPVRVLTVGRAQTPSVDALLHLIGREQVLLRLSALA
jgi:glutamyl-tRNA synthetase